LRLLRYPFTMKVHRNKVIKDETLSLDGSQFLDCALTHCTLKYNGGIVILKGTSLTRCIWEFTGPALNTVELLTTLGALRSFQTGNWTSNPPSSPHGY